MPTMEYADLDQARGYFALAQKRIAEVTTGLTDAQWRFKPAADRWSIAENLEHMLIVHQHIIGSVLPQVANAPEAPAERHNESIDRIVLEKIPDRSIKAKAPDFIEPTGQLSPSEALDRIPQSYARLAAFLESTEDLRGRVLESPPLRIVTNGEFTTMDSYQWALTVAAHDERHVRQMLEVQAHPDYPRA